MSYDLLNKFNEIKISEDISQKMSRGVITMSRNRVKMMLFAQETSLTNDNIDYWMSIKSERQSDETFTDYKSRKKFQLALLKYRPYLYDYSPYTQTI